MGAWIDHFASIATGVLALLWLFEGSRRLVLLGVRKASVLMLVGGLLISSATGGLAYLKHRMIDDAVQTLRRPVIAKHLPVPDDWGAACCKNTRESESRKLVQAAFLESGQLHAYIDASGKRIPYTPSEKDVKDREARAVSGARLEHASRARLLEAVHALIAALVAVLFGAGIGYEQRKASADRTARS